MMARESDQVEQLDLDGCRRLLGADNLGRLAVVARGRVEVFPVNYLVWEGDVYFRTAPGSKLDAVGKNPRVAFEVDGRRRRRVWSVVVHGTARTIGDEELVQSSRISRLPTDLPGTKTRYVQIEADEVTGRAFSGSAQPWGAGKILLLGAVVVVVVAVLGILSQYLHVG
jgi:hypothetical protein